MDDTALETAPEPRDALLRRAVRPGLGLDRPARLLLDAIVADRRRPRQPLLDVADLEQLALVGRVRPDAGEAVGLELEPHRELVRLRPGRAARRATSS